MILRIMKLKCLLVLLIPLLGTIRLSAQNKAEGNQLNNPFKDHNKQPLADDELVTLRMPALIDLGNLFSRGRGSVKMDFVIKGHPSKEGGFVEVTIYAPSGDDKWIPIAKMRKEGGDNTVFPDINGIEGNEIKRHMTDAKTYGMKCVDRPSKGKIIWTSALYVGLGAAEMVIGAALVAGAIITAPVGLGVTAGLLSPVYYAAAYGGIMLFTLGASTTIAGVVNAAALSYDYANYAKGKLDKYQSHFGDGDTECGFPSPYGQIVVDVRGQSFELESIHIPGMPETLPSSLYGVADKYDLTVSMDDGLQLKLYGVQYSADQMPSPYDKFSPLLKMYPQYRMPDKNTMRVMPDVVMGSQNGVTGKVTVTVPETGNILILSDKKVFHNSGLSDNPFDDMGDLLLCPVPNGDGFDLYSQKVYRVYGEPKKQITFQIGTYGPYIFVDAFTNKTTTLASAGLKLQGTGYEIKSLGDNLSLGIGRVNTMDGLPSPWLTKHVLDLNGSPNSTLKIFKPVSADASLHLMVKKDQVEKLCSDLKSSLNCTCEDLGRAFAADPEDYELVRANNFKPDPASPVQYYELKVDNYGPFVVGNFTYHPYGLDDLFNAVGENLSMDDNELRPGQDLGFSSSSDYILTGIHYNITRMAENYYHLQGTVPTPTKFLKLSEDNGKVFSERHTFYVASTPSRIPSDWETTNLGELFYARPYEGAPEILFNLYKVTNGKGKLFEVTKDGPFFLGDIGHLKAFDNQIKHIGVH